jgi:3-hydroxyacyl-CoA dehydrogenase
MALGGGCEILLHSDAVQAHAESYIGLVECGVGVVPGWGGCKEMLTRWSTPAALAHGADARAERRCSRRSAPRPWRSPPPRRKELLFLRPTDGITMNRYRLLADAKARALKLVDGYTPPKPVDLRCPAPPANSRSPWPRQLSRARHRHRPRHGRGRRTRRVLSGGPADFVDVVTEDQLLGLERGAFMRLMKTKGTLARIEHLLVTGKPLRN